MFKTNKVPPKRAQQPDPNEKYINNNIKKNNYSNITMSSEKRVRYFQTSLDVPEIILSGVMSSLVDMWHGRREKFLSTASLKAAGSAMLGNVVGQYLNMNFIEGIMPVKDAGKTWDYILFDIQDIVASSISYVLIEKLFNRDGKFTSEFMHGIITYTLAELVNEFTFKVYYGENKMGPNSKLI